MDLVNFIDNQVNFECTKTCRLCANNFNNESVLPIFSDGAHGDLVKKIQDCVSITVLKDDEHPKHICTNCNKQILQWEEFVQVCKASEDFFISSKEDKTVMDVKNLCESITVEELIISVKEEETAMDVKSQCESITAEDIFKSPKEIGLVMDVKSLGESIIVKEESLDNYDCDDPLKDVSDVVLETNDFEEFAPLNVEYISSIKKKTKSRKKPKVPCTICGKLITNVNAHMNMHLQKYKCPHCEHSSSTKNQLDKHIICVHTDIKNYICDTCGKRFSSVALLEVHTRIHSDYRRFQCSKCPYSSRTSSNLHVHYRGVHALPSGEKFICEYCSKSYITKNRLNAHRRQVHIATKEHTCTLCHKKFRIKSRLEIHMRIHTGSRPYKCKLCDGAFSRVDALKEHMRVHDENRKLHKCTNCEKGFTTKRGLIRHVCINNKEIKL